MTKPAPLSFSHLKGQNWPKQLSVLPKHCTLHVMQCQVIPQARLQCKQDTTVCLPLWRESDSAKLSELSHYRNFSPRLGWWDILWVKTHGFPVKIFPTKPFQWTIIIHRFPNLEPLNHWILQIQSLVLPGFRHPLRSAMVPMAPMAPMAMARLARPWAKPSVALVLLALHGASFVGRWPTWTWRRTRRQAGPGGVLPDGRLRDAYGWRDDFLAKFSKILNGWNGVHWKMWQFFFVKNLFD